LTFRQKGRIILQKSVLLNSPAALHKGMSMTIKEKMHGAVAVLSLKGNLMGEPDTENLRDKIYIRRFALGKYHREGRKSICHYTAGKSVQDLRNRGSGHCKL
jgi:hypothetical protein